MKRIYQMSIALLTAVLISTTAAAALPETLIPGGNTIGLQIDMQGVSVVEFTRELPRRAGLEIGDILQKINGREITTAQQLRQAVQNSGGQPLRLSYLRRGEEETCLLTPERTSEGWCLGIMVRDGISGIGTVTYYDRENRRFGALGHGVNDGSTLLPLEQGSVLRAQVVSVRRGQKGTAGALQGAVERGGEVGEIQKNTGSGIFGTMESPDRAGLPVARRTEVRCGEAEILSNVRGTAVQRYKVRILELRPEDSRNRNLLLEVTDPALLERTGGIVQGMSGSPIIQDGKLVGAVTHVLVNDPTRGYGIFIENMLDAAA